MERIYCISLIRRADRRTDMRTQLESYALPFEIFDAVDGEKIDDAYLDSHGFSIFPGWKMPDSPNPFHRRDLKKGEIGCALSHFFLWRKIEASGAPWAVILEDDAALGPDFEARLNGHVETLSSYDPNWDLLYLGRVPFAPEKEKPVALGLVVPQFSYTTTAYVVSRSGARKLLASGYEKNLIPSDEILPALYCDHPRADVAQCFGSSPRLKAYAVHPNLVTASRTDTDTEASGFLEKIGPKTVLRVSGDARISWRDGKVQVRSAVSKGNALEMDSDVGGVLVGLINAFARPTSLEQVIASSDHLDPDDLTETVEHLIEIGALEIVS